MPDDDDSRNISVRLPAETHRALIEYQRKLEKKIGGVDLSVSAIVRRIIEEKLNVKVTA